jgi:hypothetical protein
MDVTGRIASLDWELGELQNLHRELSRQMQREVEEILGGRGFLGARQGRPIPPTPRRNRIAT